VKIFRVMQHGQTRAYFYLDLFPRTGKYGHAASFTLLSGLRQRSGAYRAPVSAVVANFTTPADNHEPLLTHNEMETLFHEFGHVMHQTLTTARYATFSGSKVKQDFVETPSKMFELWLWQPEMLKRVSSHYRTGEPLPEAARRGQSASAASSSCRH
jgi:thimet oligopeptidase